MCLGFCTTQSDEGEWKDIYGDPVRPRRTGYECPPDFLQVAAWAAIIVLSVLHYMVQIPLFEGALFIVVLVITSVLVATTIVTKVVLEVLQQHDPVVFRTDLPRLDQEELVQELAPEGTEPCVFCRRFVQLGCKHCSVCDKCVPGFDHHCRWLNSCVGAKNYKLFATFMGAAWLGMAWVTAFSLYTIQWMLRDVSAFKRHMHTHAYHSHDHAFIALVVFNFVCLIIAVMGICALGKLIYFHMYLHFTHQSTYEHIVKRREKKRAKGEYRTHSGVPDTSGFFGCLALRKRRDFKKQGNMQANNISSHGGGEAPEDGTSEELMSRTFSIDLRVESPFINNVPGAGAGSQLHTEVAMPTPGSCGSFSRDEVPSPKGLPRRYAPVRESSAILAAKGEEDHQTLSSSKHEPVE
ncbi:hypothetical protein ABL78_6902 [Leptomonas seymouri]|uniref:Palmitoyltransferase n=1 Tax=Leptomonas seymouri TaxID=5684 RepID=A0A0N0P3T7_LEPSE|nr:hypothetical protein ABL78_6902 [Leptomonas seymouri]|eukprot:KPI84037.1 hypothetical protein ABL78_6902 [Leptomonas seymouri]